MVAAINRRYFEKLLPQNSNDNMLYNSIQYVDMKVCVMQLKQKSTASVSNGILRNFRTAFFKNNFGGLLLKRKQDLGFRFSLFLGQKQLSQLSYIKSWNNVLCPPLFAKRSLSIWIMLSIFIYLRKKGLSSPVFTIKILVVEIFGCY